jgi:cell division septation protein DedD
VPELSHDTAEDGFHEIQLSGKQLVFLFIVTTSVVVGVFLFGVLVGRGARDTRSEAAPASSSAAPAPSAPADTSDPRVAEPPQVPADSGEDKLSYPGLLTGGETPPAGAEKRPSEEPGPAPETTAVSPKKPDVVAAEPAAPKPSAVKPEAPPPASSRTAPARGVPAPGGSGTWLVQVIATRDQAVATSVVKKLTAKGYPAFLINPVAGAPQSFYKVQVGRYNDRSEAEQVSQRIKKEEQFQSWILR